MCHDKLYFQHMLDDVRGNMGKIKMWLDLKAGQQNEHVFTTVVSKMGASATCYPENWKRPTFISYHQIKPTIKCYTWQI